MNSSLIFNPPLPYNAETKARARSRELDISESHYLLMEMVTQEPVLQYCFKILQGTCLAQGVTLKKKGVHDQVTLLELAALAQSADASHPRGAKLFCVFRIQLRKSGLVMQPKNFNNILIPTFYHSVKKPFECFSFVVSSHGDFEDLHRLEM